MALNLNADNSRPILLDNDKSWSRVPYQVRFGDTFSDMLSAFHYMLETGAYARTKGGAEITNDGLFAYAGVNKYIKTGTTYFKDTRVGYNDAINCIWQFNRDDDIVHPIHESDIIKGIGEGRVYAATTELNQSVAWFTFGTPRFTSLATFFSEAIDGDAAAIGNTGFPSSSGFSLGYIFSGIISAAIMTFTLPILPIQHFLHKLDELLEFGVDKFYNFRPLMHMYYKFVDSITSEWLVDTGIYGNGTGGSNATRETYNSNSNIANDPGASTDVTVTVPNQYNSWTADPDSLPIALRQTGIGIFDILAHRATSLGIDAHSSWGGTYEDIIEELSKITDPDDYDNDGKYAAWAGTGLFTADDVVVDTMLGATQFVGFRIEKNVDASESFSNSTGPSELAEKINSHINNMRNMRYDFGGGDIDNLLGDNFVSGALSAVGDLLKGTINALDFDGIATAITGGAILDVPEHYTGSDFNKSHSLSFQLRSPYGDIVSIYQSIIIPLAMLLAGALPHSAGPNAYTQPFLCRVYCKGIFSVPMGIIDSLSIKRGSSEFGWNRANLPTCIDVTLTIKDLAPTMYLPISDSAFTNLFAANSSFSEYMLTLSGTGLFERISSFANFRRKAQLNAHKFRNTIFNPNMWCNWLGESSILQFIGQILPGTRISHN